MYRRILVGTDGSATAARAVDRAVEVAAADGATLTILSVGRPARAERVVADEVARLADVVAERGVTVETATAEGDAAGALLDAARDGDFDLLVTGNRGMTGISRFLRLGSVPNKVAHHLTCSLLIVKTT